MLILKKAMIASVLMLLIGTGCTAFQPTADTPDDLQPVANTPQNIELSPALPELTPSVAPPNEPNDIGDTYFFSDSKQHITYSGAIEFGGDFQNISVVLNIYRESSIVDLYELKLDKIEGIPEEKLNLGCFFREGLTIYRVNSQIDMSGIIDKSDIILNSVVVSNDEPISDVLGGEERGYHHWIDVYDNKCEYHSYSNQAETGFYEIFVWELGKGLVEYESGFGAERDSIHLTMED